MPQRALLVVNPRAGRVPSSLATVVSQLEERGFVLQRLDVGLQQGNARAVADHLNAVDLIVVAGGDGTVRAIIGALVGQAKPLGLLPLGTANDLARTLAIPSDIPAACDVISAGKTRAIDVTVVNDQQYFCNVASIGLSVQITRLLTGRAKSHWRVLAYAVAALRALRPLRHFHATIRTPERLLRTRTVQIAIGNGKYYGGGLAVAADAAIDDHLLHCYSLEVEQWWQVPALFPALRRGSHTYWRYVQTLTAAELEVSTQRPYEIDADGEIVAHTPARFRLVPEAVRVLCPPD